MGKLKDRQDEILCFLQKKHQNIINVFGLSLFYTGGDKPYLGNFVANKNRYKDELLIVDGLNEAIENDPYVTAHKWKEHLQKIAVDNKNKIILIAPVPSSEGNLSASFAVIVCNQIMINNGNCVLGIDVIKKCNKEYNAKSTHGALPDDVYKINELESKKIQESSVVILVDDTIGEGNTLLNISGKILKINPNIKIYIIALCINKTSKGKKINNI